MTQVQQKQETAQTFSCSGCGGRPVWDPESGKLKCPYCGHFTDVTADETKPEEYPLEAAPTAAQQDWGEKKRVVRCQGCGAETVLGAEETATLCPFCGSPHVLEDQTAAGIAPESVLPFKIPQKHAVSAFRKWLKKRWFAPGKAKKMATLGQISGVYLPHWTYDSDTTSTYVGEAGHHYYVQGRQAGDGDARRAAHPVGACLRRGAALFRRRGGARQRASAGEPAGTGAAL